MVATMHTTERDKIDVWSALAAPLPAGVISWRQDGRTIARDGRFLARFVAYIEANTVRERLDSVVPGEWDIVLEPLPVVTATDEDANMLACNLKAKLTILGVVREDVGTGKDWKQAATDAFKRVAVRYGIAHELYSYEQNWVQMDGDGKFARPVEDPAVAYARRYGRPKPALGGEGAARPTTSGNGTTESNGMGSSAPAPTTNSSSNSSATSTTPTPTGDVPACPTCSGPMYDNRLTKKGNQPDFKCKDRSCAKAVWVEKKKPAEDSEEIPF